MDWEDWHSGLGIYVLSENEGNQLDSGRGGEEVGTAGLCAELCLRPEKDNQDRLNEPHQVIPHNLRPFQPFLYFISLPLNDSFFFKYLLHSIAMLLYFRQVNNVFKDTIALPPQLLLLLSNIIENNAIFSYFCLLLVPSPFRWIFWL